MICGGCGKAFSEDVDRKFCTTCGRPREATVSAARMHNSEGPRDSFASAHPPEVAPAFGHVPSEGGEGARTPKESSPGPAAGRPDGVEDSKTPTAPPEAPAGSVSGKKRSRFVRAIGWLLILFGAYGVTEPLVGMYPYWKDGITVTVLFGGIGVWLVGKRSAKRWAIMLACVFSLAFAWSITDRLVLVSSEHSRMRLGGPLGIHEINVAEVQYYAKFNRYATSLTELGPPSNEPTSASSADLINGNLARGRSYGYIFALTGHQNGYVVTAVPEVLSGSDSRTFYSDDTTVIHEHPGPEPATAQDPVYVK